MVLVAPCWGYSLYRLYMVCKKTDNIETNENCFESTRLLRKCSKGISLSYYFLFVGNIVDIVYVNYGLYLKKVEVV